MASKGTGRGRGWLNLVNAKPAKPGDGVEIKAPCVEDAAFVEEKVEKYGSNNKDYSDLVKSFSCLDIEDDGIELNRKIKHILETWNRVCDTEEEVSQGFSEVHRACLKEESGAAKLAIFTAANSINNKNQEVRNVRLKALFIKQAQENFENRELLQKTSLAMFRNSVRFLGELASRFRSSNGSPYTFLAEPLMTYLEMLLNSKVSVDIALFTKLISINGDMLLNPQLVDRLHKITNTLRQLVVLETNLTNKDRLWLMLALEIILSECKPMSLEAYNFYKEQLGEEQVNVIRHENTSAVAPSSTVNSEPQPVKKSKSYKNHIEHNMLNVANNSEIKGRTKFKTKEQGHTWFDVNNSQMKEQPDEVVVYDPWSTHNNSEMKERSKIKPEKQVAQDMWYEGPNKSEMKGRPILGVGARLHKTVDKAKTWTERENWSK